MFVPNGLHCMRLLDPCIITGPVELPITRKAKAPSGSHTGESSFSCDPTRTLQVTVWLRKPVGSFLTQAVLSRTNALTELLPFGSIPDGSVKLKFVSALTATPLVNHCTLKSWVTGCKTNTLNACDCVVANDRFMLAGAKPSTGRTRW